MENNGFPIIGKWYKVIKGPYTDFIGECVSFDVTNGLPVIIQDLAYNSRAVKIDEIEACMRQPGQPDIRREDKN